MPIFKEYTAKGKLNPADMGFTAFETAARRQQSFTADQAASVEKSAKAVSQAWEGTLKFGLDELEMQQHPERGGGGVRQGSARVERTLVGTGTNPGITRNEVSRGARDLAALARGLNNRIQKPLTPADGIITDPDSGVSIARGNQARQSIVQLNANPQGIPLGPGDINLRRLGEYGVNPSKQIVAEPLAPESIGEGFKEGTVAGQITAGDIYDVSKPSPFTKSGSRIWDSISGIFTTPNVKDMTLDQDLKPSGYDKNGIPFYGTIDNPLPKSNQGTITPVPGDAGTDFTTPPVLPSDNQDQSTILPDSTSF